MRAMKRTCGHTVAVDVPNSPSVALSRAVSGLRDYRSFVCLALSTPTAQSVGWLVGIASAIASAMAQ